MSICLSSCSPESMDEIKTLFDQCVIPEVKYEDIAVVSRRNGEHFFVD